MDWSIFRRGRKTSVAELVAPSPPAKPMKIRVGAEAVPPDKPKLTAERVFAPYVPSPGVLPDGQTAATIAMDAAAGLPAVYSPNLITWANSGLFAGGLAFYGYPFLAELSQLPENRRVSYLWAEHSTRKFIKLKGDEERVEQIDKAMVRFQVRERFNECAFQDGLFGRSQLFFDLGRDTGPELATPLPMTKDKIKKDSLVNLKVVEPMWSYPGRYNSGNPLAGNFYNPDQWYVMGQTIHADRLMQFIGNEVPDILKPSYAFGGLSRTQMQKAYVDNWIGTRESVAALLKSFSVMILATDMSQILQGDCDNADLVRRVAMANMFRDNRGTQVIDKNTEEMTNIAVPLSSVPELQNQSIEYIAAIAGLPLVIYLGTTPSGLNADAEDEIRTFYTNVKAYQEQVFREPLQRVIELLQLNDGNDPDPDITFEFVDLWEMDETAKATVDKSKADAHAVYIQEGVVSGDEVRKALEADESGLYASIDLSGDAPGPPEPTSPDYNPDDPAGSIRDAFGGGDE